MSNLNEKAKILYQLWKANAHTEFLESIAKVTPLEAGTLCVYVHMLEVIDSEGVLKFSQYLMDQYNQLNTQKKTTNVSKVLSVKKEDNEIKQVPVTAKTNGNIIAPSNCTSCAFHSVIRDPDIHDSFCSDDCAVVCTKTKNTKQDKNSDWVANRQEFAIITCSCRPYNIKKESDRPDWCPLVNNV